jgi:hypothetical protein
VSLSPFTRLALAELTERIDDDGAEVIRAALAEDADDRDTGDAADLPADPGEVWADAYARGISGGLSADLATRRADAAEAHARALFAGGAEEVQP